MGIRDSTNLIKYNWQLILSIWQKVKRSELTERSINCSRCSCRPEVDPRFVSEEGLCSVSEKDNLFTTCHSFSTNSKSVEMITEIHCTYGARGQTTFLSHVTRFIEQITIVIFHEVAILTSGRQFTLPTFLSSEPTAYTLTNPHVFFIVNTLVHQYLHPNLCTCTDSIIRNRKFR